MRRFETVVLSAAALAASSCALGPVSSGPMAATPGAASAQASVRSAAGAPVAQASAEQIGESIRVRLEATGLPSGVYGAHIHAVGRCDPPAFTSAGPHWNPTGQQHGKDNPQGMHKGDLPNLMVGADGRGTLEITIPGANISGAGLAMLDADGAALVIHERPDDYRTDPSGNSGSRIACGVFG